MYIHIYTYRFLSTCNCVNLRKAIGQARAAARWSSRGSTRRQRGCCTGTAEPRRPQAWELRPHGSPKHAYGKWIEDPKQGTHEDGRIMIVMYLPRSLYSDYVPNAFLEFPVRVAVVSPEMSVQLLHLKALVVATHLGFKATLMGTWSRCHILVVSTQQLPISCLVRLTTCPRSGHTKQMAKCY